MVASSVMFGNGYVSLHRPHTLTPALNSNWRTRTERLSRACARYIRGARTNSGGTVTANNALLVSSPFLLLSLPSFWLPSTRNGFIGCDACVRASVRPILRIARTLPLWWQCFIQSPKMAYRFRGLNDYVWRLCMFGWYQNSNVAVFWYVCFEAFMLESYETILSLLPHKLNSLTELREEILPEN